MKAVVINQYGSKEVLEEAEVTLPRIIGTSSVGKRIRDIN